MASDVLASESSVQKGAAPPQTSVARITARALLLGERIDTAGLERSDVISTSPLAFRVGADGYAVIFRYGVVVLIGLSPIEEDEVRRGLGLRVIAPFGKIEDESTTIEIAPDRDDQVIMGGPISLKDLSPPRLLLVPRSLNEMGRSEEHTPELQSPDHLLYPRRFEQKQSTGPSRTQ